MSTQRRHEPRQRGRGVRRDGSPGAGAAGVPGGGGSYGKGGRRNGAGPCKRRADAAQI